MASFQDLPDELLQHIFEHVQRHESLCALQLTCTAFRAAAEAPIIWEREHRKRWTLPTSIGSDKDAYRKRHLLDRQVTGLIHELPNKTNEAGLRLVYKRITGLPVDTIETCWNISQYDEDEQVRTHARILVRIFHCVSAFEDLIRLRNQKFECEGERLEEYFIGVSRMFYDCNGPTDTTSQWIREKLDEIAEAVRRHFPSDGEPSQVEKQEIMIHILGEKVGFSVFQDQADFECLLLPSLLQRKELSPSTLTILYKCIGRRCPLHVDIFGSTDRFNKELEISSREGLRLMSPDEVVAKIIEVVPILATNGLGYTKGYAVFSMQYLFRVANPGAADVELFRLGMSRRFAADHFYEKAGADKW
jgi:hypothetical protein